jgi:SAM-dependent methyltransferase
MPLNIHRPFQRWFRPGRLQLFYRLLSITPDTRVLDLGGGSYFWDLARTVGFPLPRITVLNIRPAEAHARPYLYWVVGDARATPFEDFAFDIVFSNSLIEHLGDASSQKQFAHEVRRLAPNYFVQTPDKRFPIEPHLLAPFVHWFPESIRRPAIRNFTVWGLLNRPSSEKCEELAREIHLLSGPGMRSLFPDGQLIIERFMGLPKSVIAFRRSAPNAS